MRKLVLILLAFIAVVTFIRALDNQDDYPRVAGSVAQVRELRLGAQ